MPCVLSDGLCPLGYDSEMQKYCVDAAWESSSEAAKASDSLHKCIMVLVITRNDDTTA